jgi:hypothetical protein
LYAGIRELNSLEKNIVTIEDPVEYQFEIVNQNQVRDDIGLSFARILKHRLRQTSLGMRAGWISPEVRRSLLGGMKRLRPAWRSGIVVEVDAGEFHVCVVSGVQC